MYEEHSILAYEYELCKVTVRPDWLNEVGYNVSNNCCFTLKGLNSGVVLKILQQKCFFSILRLTESVKWLSKTKY